MSLLLALVFASAGSSATTQANDVASATGSLQIDAIASVTQADDIPSAVAQAFSQTAVSNVTQEGDSSSGRGIPELSPLGVAWSSVGGAEAETWTPVSATTGIGWNKGG